MGDEFLKWAVPAGGGGATLAVLYFIVKFVFPVMKAGWQTTTANNTAQVNMLAVLQAENATLRAQISAYIQMAEEMKLIKYQLEQANKKISDQSVLIERLTSEIHLLKGKQ